MPNREGLTLRQAAVIAGLGYLLNPVPYAEFSIYPRLVIPGHIDQTVANIVEHQGLFLTAIFCYLINFIGDIVIAWALYFLFIPVNRAVSLLAAVFRLVYAAVALVGMFNLVTVYRMLKAPQGTVLFAQPQLYAPVDLLLHSFRYIWSMSLIIFSIHLVLVGALILWSRYVPKLLGAILIIDALCLAATELKPYLWPSANIGFLFIGAFGELVFMLWLLVMGWRIKEQPA
jgi:hypothetical protein